MVNAHFLLTNRGNLSILTVISHTMATKRTSTPAETQREPVAGENRRRTRTNITSEPSAEMAVSRTGAPVTELLEWPQGKKSGTAEVFAFVSFLRDKGVFILHKPKPPLCKG